MSVQPLSTRDEQLPAAYSERLESLSLAPLWTALHSLLPHERVTRVVPHRWRWSELRGPLLEAARLVPIEQAERRVLVLCNPGLPGNFSATATLYAGFQVILPGEAAPSHHHTAAALRLIVEGEGAYTTVDGVKCVMEPGDLIITPPMRWHDHGHEGRDPVIWLDGLDIPLVRGIEANWASPMKPAAAPTTDIDSSQDEFTAAGLVPRRSRYEETGYPQVRWPWRTVRAALASLAATAARRAAVVLRHVNPRTGEYPLRTMGSEARWLRPGEESRAGRRTVSEVVHVIEGQGESRVGDRVLDWQAGDAFVVPPWQEVEHRNRSGTAPACLFHLNDEPALRALGLWHEEAAG
ncbi:MAG TPA: cupin domain-containing protein [Candidatus Nitrosotalea sp.]|nr:cupin domain-containing protein [Candidatus Nitrosotalea sp.]